jgi:hypothetical protein
MAVHLLGDFVDLHSFTLKVMDHAVAARSACVQHPQTAFKPG